MTSFVSLKIHPKRHFKVKVSLNINPIQQTDSFCYIKTKQST